MKKVADYIGNTSPSFTAFTYCIFLRYRTDPQSNETIFDQTGDEIFAHALAILIYRNENLAQIYAIDSNEGTDNYKSAINVMNKKVLRSLKEVLKTFTDQNFPSLIWNTPFLFTPHQFNSTGSKTNDFIEEGYCGLISLFFIDLFHRNIMINDSLQLFHDPPSETEVAFYIEQCLSFVYYFYSSDSKRWSIFLCNYARNVLQDITFHDGSKSLNEYKQELLFQNETFKIRNLIDILHNPNYNGNTEYVNIISKRYICTRKFQVHVIGFNLNSTDDINVLLDQPQINNNFEYFIPDKHIRQIVENADDIPTSLSMKLVHLTDYTVSLYIENTKNNITIEHHDETMNLITVYNNDLSQIKLLFFNLRKSIKYLFDVKSIVLNRSSPINFHLHYERK